MHCGQMAGWIKVSLGREVGLGPRDIVLDRDRALPQKIGLRQPPTIRPMYCGQMAGWIKMPLGADVGLSPGHTGVRCGKGHSTPKLFGTSALVVQGSWLLRRS